MKPLRTLDFLLEPGQVPQVLEGLRERFSLLEEPAPPVGSTVYDTFDWRLRADGGTLEVQHRGPASELLWSHLGGAVRHRLELPKRNAAAPPFAWDYPEGPLRRDLEAVIEMRRLLPRLRLDRRGTTLRVLDDEEKTTVRIRLVETTVTADGDGPKDLAPRLEVAPVRGYPKPAEKVTALLRDLGCELAEGRQVDEALRAVGLRPEDHPGKLTLSFDPQLPAADAARSIHLALLHILELNEDGTRRDIDSEYLHDFRVAVRRTRSALSQVKGVFAVEDVARFKTEFSWLGKVTGPTRDLDVYLLKMPAYRDQLPETVRRDLEPLERFLADRQRKAQRALARVLGGNRYRRLVADWRSFLESPPEVSGEDAPNAAAPVLGVASSRIWKIYRRILKWGHAIDDTSPAERLHEVRIEAKKLRYLMEFFRGLYPKDEVTRAIKALKRLQDNLGDFNDYEVQQGALGGFAEEMAGRDDVPAATLLAMGRLVAHLEEGQERERRDFHRRFERFAGEEDQARYRRLFRGAGRAGG
ncbi:MAG: CHAD domain-containing protein [Acidobacteriota bacterium]